MNAKQTLIIGVATFLIVLTFVFPYSSYPTKETLADGVTHRSTTRSGFVPIWKVREANSQATLKGNIFDDVVIIWPAVLGFATVIIAVAGVLFYQAREAGSPTSQATPSTGLTKEKILTSVLHGIMVAAIYLGVKYFVRGIIERDLWMALVIGTVIALMSARPAKETSKEPQAKSE